MNPLANLTLVFVAGLVTALATGVGALPFFLFEEVSDRWNVVLWGLASGIMVSASVFGLLREGLAAGTLGEIAIGLGTSVLLVVGSHRVLSGVEVNPRQYEEADYRKLVLVLGVLTVHSFPEGVAVGVSFADIGFTNGISLFGLTVPVLAVFMTVAISIHNVPEGVAVSIPLSSMGVPKRRVVWWSVFSSLPQPVGAVIAFYFRACRPRVPRDRIRVRCGRDDIPSRHRVPPRGARGRARAATRRPPGTRFRRVPRRGSDDPAGVRLIGAKRWSGNTTLSPPER
jgi:ZIP family zinc transporter